MIYIVGVKVAPSAPYAKGQDTPQAGCLGWDETRLWRWICGLTGFDATPRPAARAGMKRVFGGGMAVGCFILVCWSNLLLCFDWV